MVYRPLVNRRFFYRPLYALAASALVLALATDVTYYVSSDFIWLDMSDWLVSIGAIFGFLALVVGLIEVLRTPREFRPSWIFFGLSLLAWLAATLNAFVHSRDGLTSVDPLGVGLSALTCILLVLAWWANASAPLTPYASEISA